jgi:hypothetical protein
MMTKCLRAGVLSIAAAGLVLQSGCVLEPNGAVVFRPVVVAPPPPVVFAPPPPLVVAPNPEPLYVPDNYVWDGYEYVGVVGDQCFYLGPGNVWLVCEPFRLERFRGWERGHADWRAHAIVNDRFRRDQHGHVQPRREEPRREEHREH